MRKISVLAALLLLVATVYFAPTLLKQTILYGLKTQDIHLRHFTIEHIGTTQLTMRDITLENSPVQSVNTLIVTYDLFSRKLHTLHAKNINVDLKEQDIKLKIASFHVLFDGENRLLTIGPIKHQAELPHFKPLTLTGIVTPQQEGYRINITEATYSIRAQGYYDTVQKKGTIDLHLYQAPIALFISAIKDTLNVSGFLSGTIPLLIADGTLTIAQGNLHATDKGIIRYHPALPKLDNPSLALLYDVLQQFHYETLGVTINSEDKDTLKVRFSLYGRNPNLYDGRIFKLKIQLSGNLMDLIQSSLGLYQLPETILEQIKDETTQ